MVISLWLGGNDGAHEIHCIPGDIDFILGFCPRIRKARAT